MLDPFVPADHDDYYEVTTRLNAGLIHETGFQPRYRHVWLKRSGEAPGRARGADIEPTGRPFTPAQLEEKVGAVLAGTPAPLA